MKTAEIVNQGETQIVHLPADLRLEGSEVYVKRVGRSLVLIPKDANLWQILEDSLDEFTDDFMADRAQPSEQVREALFE